MTIHETITAARRDADCAKCGAVPGGQCDCGPCGCHICRIARAHFRGQAISDADFASLIADADVFDGGTVVLDPEAVA